MAKSLIFLLFIFFIASSALQTAQRRVLRMHFDEAGSGNAAGLLPRERYIATNRFNVRPGKQAAFEKRWATRKSRLATLDGFRFFALLKQRETLSGPEPESSLPNYVSFTIWKEKENFDAWRTGEAFKEAHGGGGIKDFMQLLTTALFILKGKPNPAFYDGLHPLVTSNLEGEIFRSIRPNSEGWRTVEADGVNEIPHDLIVVQDRYAVKEDQRATFENALGLGEAQSVLANAPGFFGTFVQRRDAAKADDNCNYMISHMFKDVDSFHKFKASHGAARVPPSECLAETPSSVLYEAKLALLSSAGP